MVNSKYQDIWNTYSESPFPTLILSKSCLISAPGMDGYEVCRRLKEDQSTLDILTA
jgi:CheY-like chemotaxis protein